MNKGKGVWVRDATIAGAIVLNFGFLRWRQIHAGDQPPKAITSESVREIIGNPSNELGDPVARYVLVEFGDYQCPPCAYLFPDIEKVLAQHRQTLRFQFRHYPLPGHPLAFPAAMLAESARRSGRFEAVHSALYMLGAKLQERDLQRIASANGLHYTTLARPGEADKEIEAIILNDKAVANKIPVKGTPSLFLCMPDNRVLEVYGAAQIEGLIR